MRPGPISIAQLFAQSFFGASLIQYRLHAWFELFLRRTIEKRERKKDGRAQAAVFRPKCVFCGLLIRRRYSREISRMGLVSCAFDRNPYDVNRPPYMLAASLATDLVSTGDGGELRYRCVMCGRGYRSRSSLTRHSRYECGRLGSRYTFTCTLCGKYFCRPDHLKQHILNIHGGAVAK